MEELLKSLELTEEVRQKVLEKYNKDLEISKTELEKQLEFVKSEIKERDDQLKELSKIDVNKLQETLKSYEEKNKSLVESHELELNKLKTDYAIERALTEAGARNLKAVTALLELEGLSLDDKGSLKGISEQIEKLKADETSSFLFEVKKAEVPQFTGVVVGESDPDTRNILKDVSKMDYVELYNYCESQGGNI